MLRLCSLLKPTRTTKKTILDGYKEHFRKHDETGRNGQTRSIFGDCSMKFSLKKRKNAYTDDEKNGLKTCLRELLWFIHGSTDNTLLNPERSYMDLNSTREWINGVKRDDDGDIDHVRVSMYITDALRVQICKYNYETKGPTAKHNRFVKEPRNTVVGGYGY
jgi:thymidylate synthase